MPSITTYFPNDEADTVRSAALEAKQTESAYIAAATRERMRREGHMPGTPAHDVRSEAVATCNVVGPEATLAALRALRAEDEKRGPAAAA